MDPESLKKALKTRFIKNTKKLDRALNQLAEQIGMSEHRNHLSKISINGFNQKSLDKYIKNNYKIFSLYAQGNITPDLWVYRDKRGNLQGPFMSYDMDIWNDEEDYFSDNIEISFQGIGGPYYNIHRYLDRDPEIVQKAKDFMGQQVCKNSIQKN